jgi:uncharacterized DUF497 family protein
MNFAGEHPDLFLEMTADGEIMVMPPREPSRFEWDPGKAALNWRKHGVSFETATRVFTDPNALFAQDRVENGEIRRQAIGLVEDTTLLLVAHAANEDRGHEVIRIISARNADRKERKRYEETNGLLPN